MGTVKRIVFINGKGGCGKTTSIVNVAGVLADRGEKVLVIDLDKQKNTTATLLMHADMPGQTFFDFLAGTAEAADVAARALFKRHGNAKPKYYGVDVMGSDSRLEDEAALAGMDGAEAGRKLEAFIEDRGYAWVLVDMPPSSLALNNICFRYLVDYAIVPFSSDIYSVDGYGDIMDTLDRAREDNPSLSVLGVYLARYSAGCGLDQYIREQLLRFDTFIDIQIPQLAEIREAVFYGRPCSFYRRGGRGAEAYGQLVDEIGRRISQM